MKKIICLVPLLVLTAAAGLYAQVPNLLTYQGRLKEGGQAITGTRSVEILLCNAPTGVTCYSTGAQPVTVSNGLFRSTFTVPSAADISSGNWYLEIWVGGTGLTPRERLTSSAYSLLAGTAAYSYNLAAAPGAAGVYISTDIFLTAGKYHGDGSLLSNLPAAVIADGSITGAKILDGTITAADIAVSTISLDKLNQSGCTSGQIPKWSGSAWACAADNGSGAAATADEASLHLTGSVFSALSSSVTLQGNNFNAANKLVMLDASGALPVLNGSSLTSLNPANMQNGTLGTGVVVSSVGANGVRPGSILPGSIVAADIAVSTISLDKLNQSGCTSGQIPKWSGSAWACAVDNGAGAAYTADEASLHLTGSVFSALNSSVTLQGNSFNAANKLLMLDGSGRLPALDASQVVKVSSLAVGGVYAAAILDGAVTNAKLAGSISDDKLAQLTTPDKVSDYALTSNVDLLNTNQTVTGKKTFTSTFTITSNAFSVGGSTFVVQSGSVGIGTANPGAQLDIHTGNGTSGLKTDLICPNAATSKLYTDASGNIVCGTDQGGGGGVNIVDTLADTLGAGNDAGGLNMVNLGSVGIGMGAPTTKLGVSGGILATSSITAQGNISAAFYQIGSSGTVLGLLGNGTSLVVGPPPSGGTHNATGDGNTFVGYGTANTTGSGSSNTWIGFEAGYYATSGMENTALGYEAGVANTTGSHNIFVGWNAGYDVATGSGNIVIGYHQPASGAGVNDKLNIGGVLFGDLAAGRIGIGINNPGATLDVAGQVKITGGSPGANKVLTSDAVGLATWQVAESTFSIGDSYYGGIVFWVDASGKHGLISATADLGSMVWSSGTGFTTGATVDAVYSGRRNTSVIVSTQSYGSYAAKACADYGTTLNNEYYDGWYLPSSYEMGIMYAQKALLGTFTASYYWSSTEDSPTTAVVRHMGTGAPNTGYTKTNPGYVRCIRAFP